MPEIKVTYLDEYSKVVTADLEIAGSGGRQYEEVVRDIMTIGVPHSLDDRTTRFIPPHRVLSITFTR